MATTTTRRKNASPTTEARIRELKRKLKAYGPKLAAAKQASRTAVYYGKHDRNLKKFRDHEARKNGYLRLKAEFDQLTAELKAAQARATRETERPAARSRKAPAGQLRLFNPGKLPAPRKNPTGPGAADAKQYAWAVAQICRHRDQKAGRCTPSYDDETLAAVEMIRDTPASKRREWARQAAGMRRSSGRRQNPRSSGRRPNPDNGPAAAAEMFEAFTQRPSTHETLVEERVHTAAHHAELGKLIELQIILPSGKHLATAGFQNKGILVTAAGFQREDDGTIYGTELHLVGGNQAVDLADFKAEEQAGKPAVLLGELYKITYFTSKGFHDFKPSEYEHELGEESGERPTVGYDPRSKKLFLVGGAYTVKPAGITN